MARLNPKFKVTLGDQNNLTSRERTYWRDLIVEPAPHLDRDNPIVKLGWGIWVSDGKNYQVMFHEELLPYDGKARVGDREVEGELENE
jgi:hypothetical protein